MQYVISKDLSEVYRPLRVSVMGYRGRSVGLSLRNNKASLSMNHPGGNPKGDEFKSSI